MKTHCSAAGGVVGRDTCIMACPLKVGASLRWATGAFWAELWTNWLFVCLASVCLSCTLYSHIGSMVGCFKRSEEKKSETYSWFLSQEFFFQALHSHTNVCESFPQLLDSVLHDDKEVILWGLKEDSTAILIANKSCSYFGCTRTKNQTRQGAQI